MKQTSFQSKSQLATLVNQGPPERNQRKYAEREYKEYIENRRRFKSS